MEQILLAAGNFFTSQYYFDQLPGIVSSTVGYSGGSLENPTHEEVTSGSGGHAEVVLLEFDNSLINCQKILEHFFEMHDPTSTNKQGTDSGSAYRSAIYYVTEDQKVTAEKVIEQVAATRDRPIVTLLEQAGPFYEAEPQFQKYLAGREKREELDRPSSVAD